VVAQEPLKILVDFDSTINQFDQHMLATVNDRFGLVHEYSSITTWGFLDFMEQPEVGQWAWGPDVYNSYRWTLGIPPMPGAAEAMRNLKKAGHQVRIVTARKNTHQGWIEDWLRTHGFGPFPCSYNEKKSVWARRYGYTIAIDDAPHQARDLMEEGVFVYLVDKPYNREIGRVPHPESRISRVDSLAEASRIILGEADSDKYLIPTWANNGAVQGSGQSVGRG
jgi:hypothetical protein